jgi:DNA-binding XRE family transcriptional regulator
MKNKQPQTISLKEFSNRLTLEQKKMVAEEIDYYYLLTQFKDTREKMGISQEELAKKAQINRTTLSRVETGSRNATIETLNRIASAMDMQLNIHLSPY